MELTFHFLPPIKQESDKKMGRIRTSPIKNLSEELLKMYPDKLGRDFNKNKEFLRSIIESKKARNKIAGYISALKRNNN